VTQHPTEETRDAFWTMLWDHNAQTVVLLTPTSDEEVGHTEICFPSFNFTFHYLDLLFGNSSVGDPDPNPDPSIIKQKL
jgi:hypothetical protein